MELPPVDGRKAFTNLFSNVGDLLASMELPPVDGRKLDDDFHMVPTRTASMELPPVDGRK